MYDKVSTDLKFVDREKEVLSFWKETHVFEKSVELRRGAPYHFTKDEERAIGQHNEQYRCQTSPETLLLAYFEPAERHKDNFMRAVDIQRELQKKVRAADVPNLKLLTLTMKACGFQHGSYNGQRGWYARRRETPVD